MSLLQFGVAPKMKPISRKRAALVAALDVGTSKVVCAIARLEPSGGNDVLRRRSHSIEVIGFGHTEARGMKAGSVADLDAADHAIRHAVELAEKSAGVHLELVAVSISAGRFTSERFTASVDVAGPSIRDGDIARLLRGRQPAFRTRRAGGAAFAAARLCDRRRPRDQGSARHAGAALRARHACGERRCGGAAQSDAGDRTRPALDRGDGGLALYGRVCRRWRTTRPISAPRWSIWAPEPPPSRCSRAADSSMPTALLWAACTSPWILRAD